MRIVGVRSKDVRGSSRSDKTGPFFRRDATSLRHTQRRSPKLGGEKLQPMHPGILQGNHLT
jgi:hypothetical protein